MPGQARVLTYYFWRWQICSLFYVYMFWFLLGHDDEDLPLEDKHLNTYVCPSARRPCVTYWWPQLRRYNAFAEEMTTGEGMGDPTVNSMHARS